MADPDTPDLDRDLYALIVYLHVRCNGDLLNQISREGLTLTQLRLLEQLRGERLRPTMHQAALLMHVSDAGATRMVTELERRKLVRREEADHDYRSKRVEITPDGERVIGRLHAARLEQIEAFTRGLNDQEREQLEDALLLLLERDQIRAFRPPSPEPLPA